MPTPASLSPRPLPTTDRYSPLPGMPPSLPTTYCGFSVHAYEAGSLPPATWKYSHEVILFPLLMKSCLMTVHPGGATGTLVPAASKSAICASSRSPAWMPAGTDTFIVDIGALVSASGPAATKLIISAGVGVGTGVGGGGDKVASGVAVGVRGTKVAVGGTGVDAIVGVVVSVGVVVAAVALTVGVAAARRSCGDGR